MSKINKNENGDVIVDLNKERFDYIDIGQKRLPYSQLRGLGVFFLIYIVCITVLYELMLCVGFIPLIISSIPSIFRSYLLILIPVDFCVMGFVVYINYKLCKMIVHYFAKKLDVTYKVYDLYAKITHDFMNIVLINPYAQSFVLLGEYLDPSQSTQDKLVFTGLPEGYVELDGFDFNDETEYEAFKDVSKLDLFSKKESKQYYDQVVRLEQAKQEQAEVERQKQYINLKQTIRENRGFGYSNELNQRFRQAVDDLENEIDKNEEK